MTHVILDTKRGGQKLVLKTTSGFYQDFYFKKRKYFLGDTSKCQTHNNLEWQGFRHLKTTFRFQGERPLLKRRWPALGSRLARWQVRIHRGVAVELCQPLSLQVFRQPLRNILATWEKATILKFQSCFTNLDIPKVASWTSSSHHWSKFEKLSYFLPNHAFITFHHLSTPLGSVFSHPAPNNKNRPFGSQISHQQPCVKAPPETPQQWCKLRGSGTLRIQGSHGIHLVPWRALKAHPFQKMLAILGWYKTLTERRMVLRKQTYKKKCAWTSRLLDCNFFSCGSVGVCLKGGEMTDTFLLDVLFFSRCAPQLRWA